VVPTPEDRSTFRKECHPIYCFIIFASLASSCHCVPELSTASADVHNTGHFVTQRTCSLEHGLLHGHCSGVLMGLQTLGPQILIRQVDLVVRPRKDGVQRPAWLPEKASGRKCVHINFDPANPQRTLSLSMNPSF
jgi:hypothetical protein